MATSISLATRFSDWVVPQLTASGCFGPSSKIVKYSVDSGRKGEDQFSSTVQFFELRVLVKDILQTINVVVKFQPEDVKLRESMVAKDHFQNEVLAYSVILPLLEKNGIVKDLFPEYYLGSGDPNKSDDSDYIVIEDLSKIGYRLTNEKVFLDYDHCILALKGIGRLHALSYAAKKNKRTDFMAAISQIKEKWTHQRILEQKNMLSLCGERGAKPLINKKHHAELLTEFLKNYDDPIKFYSSLVDPVEPEAVFCHGDFCRNNMLFAYNDDGKPVSVKFFDLQTPRYSSPVIDLSFFLLMNTNKDLRDKYWDEFISVYSNSVKSVVPDVDIPELDFKRTAVYGYLHCSFFLPMMMMMDESNYLDTAEIFTASSCNKTTEFIKLGSEKETEALIDIVQFLLCRGYIREKYF